MHARVTFYDVGTASRDDAVRGFEQARGAVEQMQGNQGAMLLVDEETGKAITITLWESEQALRATEQEANRAREQAAGGAGMTIREVEAYEMVAEFSTP